jgi:hypothetical protein
LVLIHQSYSCSLSPSVLVISLWPILRQSTQFWRCGCVHFQKQLIYYYGHLTFNKHPGIATSSIPLIENVNKTPKCSAICNRKWLVTMENINIDRPQVLAKQTSKQQLSERQSQHHVNEFYTSKHSWQHLMDTCSDCRGFSWAY